VLCETSVMYASKISMKNLTKELIIPRKCYAFCKDFLVFFL